MDSALRRSLAILAAVVVVTAWFSATFYFPDEHYQVLEFMAYKLETLRRRPNCRGNFPPVSDPGSSRRSIF